MIRWFNARHLVLRVGRRATACSLLLASNYLLLIITGFQLLFLYHNWLSITSYKSQLACVYLLWIMTGSQLANFRWVEPSSTCSFSAHCCFANHFRSLASIFNFDLKSTMSAGLGVWCFQFLMKYFCPMKAILGWFSFLLGCAICLYVSCNLFAMNTWDF